jgi:hypothetical protein
VNNEQCTSITSPVPASGPNSEIVVIFTDRVRTKAALTAACRLGHGLDLPLTLLAPRVVPYPLPLECSPVPATFIEREMTHLVKGLNAEITIHILLCRNRTEAVKNALGPESLVVIGTGNLGWRFRYRNLVQLLRAEGLRLILID